MNGKELHISKNVLVLGNSSYGYQVAAHVRDNGYPVILSITEPSDYISDEKAGEIEILMPSVLVDVKGGPGDFKVVLGFGDGSQARRTCGCIIVAMECSWVSARKAWNLPPRENVLSLSQVCSDPEAFMGKLDHGGKIVFVCGFVQNSYSFTQRQVAKIAGILAKRPDLHVYVFMEHFKVSEQGVEKQIRRARDQGAVFVKFSESRPDILVNDDKIVIKYYDEGLGGWVEFSPDAVVLEESSYPPPEAQVLSRALEVRLDNQGFFQADSLHNLPIYCNRTGVFVVGSGKGTISEAQSKTEAKAVAVEVAKLLEGFEDALGQPSINLEKKKCAICLTCYRVCPHRAISHRNRRPEFSPLACKRCGMCVAVCPMNAIELEASRREDVVAELKGVTHRFIKGTRDHLPHIVVLACQNSAYDAYLLARQRGLDIQAHTGVVKIPCGGRVDSETVLKAFANGIDCVMVLACPHDSCKSSDGSMACSQTIEVLHEMLEETGIDAGRLIFDTLGPGSAMEFVDLVNQVAKELEER